MAASDTKASLPVLTAKDFASDQDVRWCPGCGDYAILNHVRKVCAKIGATKENTVFVSGIGCSSRFPYYMDTYGFHTIHGRGPAIATGIKVARPELDVWLVTGDGDGLSIGGNHLIHILRRNVNVKILLFNNRIYGLTKGQYSPTSEEGKKTKSSPMGSLDMPLRPISVALAAEASFVARAVDVDKRLGDVMEAAVAHQGSAFVEIYQDCNVFNHRAFQFATDKDSKEDATLWLEHGKPMVFGKNRDKGIRLEDGRPAVVELGNGVSKDDLLFHDVHDEARGFMLSRMRHDVTKPEEHRFPEPMGVFYQIDDECYEAMVNQQVQQARQSKGEGSIKDMLYNGDVYEVK